MCVCSFVYVHVLVCLHMCMSVCISQCALLFWCTVTSKGGR